jgi:predicted lipoprotein with Yx(FWY)xxD motif
MKISRNEVVIGLMSVVTITATSCSKNDNKVSAPTPAPKEITLQTSGTLGNYLVDKQNRTLYFFSNDPSGQDSCTDGCQAYWPIFNVDNLTADKLGDGLSLSDFGSVTSVSGKRQLTYKGWPLYYFAPLVNGTNVQESPGQMRGEGVNNEWFVAKPDYTIMQVNGQLLGHDGKTYKSDYTEGIGKTTYFTDGNGLTLYTFKFDSLNTNKFTKPDFSNNNVWPIYETNKVVVPSTLDKTKFGSITVFGRTQLTYNGWPLYYFGQDGQTRGSNKGISFPAPGYWPVPFADIGQAPHN